MAIKCSESKLFINPGRWNEIRLGQSQPWVIQSENKGKKYHRHVWYKVTRIGFYNFRPNSLRQNSYQVKLSKQTGGKSSEAYLSTGDGGFPHAQVLTPPVCSCHVQLKVCAFFLYQKYFILQLRNNLSQGKQTRSYKNT